MDNLFQRSSKPEGESGASPNAPGASNSKEPGMEASEELDALLSVCVRGEAASRRTAVRQLLEWVRSCHAGALEKVINILLHRSTSSSSLDIQSAAESVLVLIVNQCPVRNDEITDCLLSKLPWQNWTVGAVMSSILAESMRVCPRSGSKIILEMYRHAERGGVPMTAHSLQTLLKGTSVQIAHEALDGVLHQWNSRCLERRTLAAGNLALFAKARPDKREIITTELLRGTNDTFEMVRAAALKSLCAIAEMFPEKEAEIFAAILGSCDDQNGFVRLIAVWQLRRYVIAYPERAEETYAKAFLLSSDKDSRIRAGALDLLVEVVNLCPEKLDEVAVLVLAGCRDEAHCVKRGALHLVGKLMGTCSRQRSEEMADVLMHCCRIGRRYPEGEALNQMGRVVRMFPARTEEIVDIVLHWSKSRNRGSWLPEWHDYLQSVLQKMKPESLASKLPEITFPTAKANAVGQFGHVAGACPRRAQEILSLLLRMCEGRDDELQLAAATQLGLMAQACPGEVDQIAAVALHFCSNESWVMRTMAVVHLSELAVLSTGDKEPIIEALLRACNDRRSKVRALAIVQLPKAMRACPEMAKTIFSVLLTKYTSAFSLEAAVIAEKQLGTALTACPDVAIDVLETLMKHRPTKKRRLM